MTAREDHSSEHLHQRGCQLLQEKAYDEAVKVLAEAFRVDPDNYAVLTDYNWALLFAKEWKKAVAISRARIVRNADDGMAYHCLGSALEGLELFARAEAAFRTAIEKGPVDVVSYSCLADVLLAREKYHEAMAAANQAVLLEPDYEPALVSLGEAHFGLADFRGAIEAYEKIAEVSSNPAYAVYKLAFLYRLTGNEAATEQAIQRLEALDADWAQRLRQELAETGDAFTAIRGVEKVNSLLERIPVKEFRGSVGINLAGIGLFLFSFFVLFGVTYAIFRSSWCWLSIIPAYLLAVGFHFRMIARKHRREHPKADDRSPRAPMRTLIWNGIKALFTKEYGIVRSILGIIVLFLLIAGAIVIVGAMFAPIYGALAAFVILITAVKLRKDENKESTAFRSLNTALSASGVVIRIALRDILIAAALALLIAVGSLLVLSVYKFGLGSQGVGMLFLTRLVATIMLLVSILSVFVLRELSIKYPQAAENEDIETAMDSLDPHLDNIPPPILRLFKYIVVNPTIMVVSLGTAFFICFGFFSQMGGAGNFSAAGVGVSFRYLIQELLNTITLDTAGIFGLQLVDARPDSLEAGLYMVLVKFVMFTLTVGYVVLLGSQVKRELAKKNPA